jgi:hypothetical protein
VQIKSAKKKQEKVGENDVHDMLLHEAVKLKLSLTD